MTQVLRRVVLALVVCSVAAGTLLFGTPNVALAKSNRFIPGFCTWYAANQFNAIAPEPGANWTGAAQDWYDHARARDWDGSTRVDAPMKGAIVVWRNGSASGHVAVVRDFQMSGDGRTVARISVEEMNWGALEPGFWDQNSRYYLHTVNFNKTTTPR